MQASLMCSGVSKSGSPAANPQTSSPAACKAFAFPSTASVGEGETLRAQVESGAGELLIDRSPDQKVRPDERQAVANRAAAERKRRGENRASVPGSADD